MASDAFKVRLGCNTDVTYVLDQSAASENILTVTSQAKGNAAFAAGNHEEAIKHFTEGIAVDPSNHVLYSNRSASYVSIHSFAKFWNVTDGHCLLLARQHA